MFERFSPGARGAIVVSQELARRFRQPAISSLHVVLAAMGGEDEAVEALFAEVGTDRPAVVGCLAALTVTGETDLEGDIPFGTDAKELMRSSMPAAHDTGSSTIEVLHLVLAGLRTGAAPLVEALGQVGITEPVVAAALAPPPSKGVGGFLRRGKRAPEG